MSIHAVERFLGDEALAKGWTVQPRAHQSGKRVLVVGAGPSGLSTAWHLALLGHSVVIHEAGPMAGGMMHFGIPKYRLPREVLDAEIRRIQDLGVEIVLNHKVEDLLVEKAAGRFDAVFLAVGAHLSRRQDIPARDAGKIYDALQFLASVEGGDAPPKIGRRVAIYGGGNTAMDAARTARRLGAEPLIIYRRTREQMPAHAFEADEAIEEGVKIHWLRTIKHIDGTTFTVEVMKLDDRGFPQPTGEIETLEADSLILALGQDTDTASSRRCPAWRSVRTEPWWLAPTCTPPSCSPWRGGQARARPFRADRGAAGAPRRLAGHGWRGDRTECMAGADRARRHAAREHRRLDLGVRAGSRAAEIANRLGLERVRFAPGRLPEPRASVLDTAADRPAKPSVSLREEGARLAAGIEDENLRKIVARAAAASLAKGPDGRSV